MTTSALNRKTVKSVDGVDLYYEVTQGSASAPVLFFVHGVGGDLDAWQFIKDALIAKGFAGTIIAMDLRGHGKSGHPRSRKSYALDRFTDDFVAILGAEHVDKVILVGHSLGAVLSTHITLAHQDRIEKLVLISSSYLPPPYFNTPGMMTLFDILAIASLPPIDPGHSVYPAGKFHKDVEPFGLVRTIFRNSMKSYILSSKEILKTNIGPRLSEITVPTLLISGDRDTIFPTPISEYIHSKIPHSELKIIPDGNHVVVLNNVAETTKHILDFTIASH